MMAWLPMILALKRPQTPLSASLLAAAARPAGEPGSSGERARSGDVADWKVLWSGPLRSRGSSPDVAHIQRRVPMEPSRDIGLKRLPPCALLSRLADGEAFLPGPKRLPPCRLLLRLDG